VGRRAGDLFLIGRGEPRYEASEPTELPMTPHSIPDWVDRIAYPFTPKTFATPDGAMSYVDEGDGPPIVFVHGNPTWSFMYRELIKGLRGRYRCLAPDHIGFGLSDKPRGFAFPQFHAENLELLITALLKDITLVVHEWGTPIALAYATRHPENVSRLIILNSACWSLKAAPGAERVGRRDRGRIRRFLGRRFNPLLRLAIPRRFSRDARLAPAIRRQYLGPFPTPESRDGVWTLATSLAQQSDWLEWIWLARGLLRDKPVLLLWGERDPIHGPATLARWEEAFPRHATIRYANVGHCVAEELGRGALEPVGWFLRATAESTAVEVRQRAPPIDPKTALQHRAHAAQRRRWEALDRPPARGPQAGEILDAPRPAAAPCDCPAR